MDLDKEAASSKRSVSKEVSETLSREVLLRGARRRDRPPRAPPRPREGPKPRKVSCWSHPGGAAGAEAASARAGRGSRRGWFRRFPPPPRHGGSAPTVPAHAPCAVQWAADAVRSPAQVTRAEVARHDKPDDLWIIVGDKVYDLTKWAHLHPGGRKSLHVMAGRDGTDAFEQYHPAWVWEKRLPYFEVARLQKGEKEEPSPFVADMRALRQDLLEEGMFETRYSYYVSKYIILTALFATALYLTFTGTSPWTRLLGAVFMGVFWQQQAFVGHDTAHTAITHDMEVDHLTGMIVGNTLGGIAIGWWKSTHNVHHVVCNSVEADPDIQHMPIFAVTDKILAKPFYSLYHLKWVTFDPLSKLLVSFQHYLYYPIMCLARFNLYLQSLILLLSPNSDVKYPRTELALCLTFHAWFTAMLFTLPTATERIAYLLIANGVTGLLHVQITLSHFAMETYHGITYTDNDREGWFHTQLRTSLDVDCPKWLDWLHGGLQFQVEHHMFPRLPRHNLRYVHERVRAICAKHGETHHTQTFVQCNRRVIAALRDAANKARATPWSECVWSTSMLSQGLNAQG